MEICFSDCDEFSQSWEEIYNNDHVGQGSETPNNEKVVVNLTQIIYDAYLSNDLFWPDSFRIRFRFVGENYFWIIDDVSICEGNPYPPTDPPDLGDLLKHEHPYDVDDMGGAYVPNQLVIEYTSDTPDSIKASIRDSLGVDSFVVCECNRLLELWIFRAKPDGNADSPDVLGKTIININELKQPARTKSRVHDDGVSFNYYTYGDIKGQTPFPPDPIYSFNLPTTPSGIPPKTTGEIVVAHLDSGIDYFRPELASRIWQNDGSGCYNKDLIGHDFVFGNNNVLDYNDHGTRTALQLVNQLPFLNCPYKIMPLRTHDHHGVGTLFNNTCAMYYALREKANVALLSWGWIGEETNILKRAIDSLGIQNNAVVVNAVGNDGLLLNTARVFPAVYNSPNLITVGSVLNDGGMYVHSDFSNYSNSIVDIGALGEGLAIPGMQGGPFAGTSYAAPQVASTVAALQCISLDSVQEILARLYNCTESAASLKPYIIDGRVLQPDYPCFFPSDLSGQLVYGLTKNGSAIIAFDSDFPGIIRKLQTIRGVDSAQVLSGMDFRPATGELFALGYNQSTGESRLYKLDPNAGLATAMGDTVVFMNTGMGELGMDFNPVSDQIRVTGSDKSNFRLNPVTGAVAGADDDLAFAPGDPFAGADPAIGATAYNNSFKNATSTTLYNYDYASNILTAQVPPNGGMLSTIGPANIAVELLDPSIDLDIFYDPEIKENTAFFAANLRNETADDFFTVDLQTGAATLVGRIGSGIALSDIAVSLKEPEEPCESKVIGCIKYEVLGIKTDSLLRKIYRIRVTNNCPENLVYSAFSLPKGVLAQLPEDNTLYASPAGHSYAVRNPSFSPFYSIRFLEQGAGVAGGQSDVFEFAMPPYVQQAYLYVSVMLKSRVAYATYLSLFGCSADQSSFKPLADERMQDVSTPAAKRIYLFPNPSQGLLTIAGSGWNSEPANARVLNAQGQTVFNVRLLASNAPQQLNLPEQLPEGIYFLEFLTESGERQTRRFALQR